LLCASPKFAPSFVHIHQVFHPDELVELHELLVELELQLQGKYLLKFQVGHFCLHQPAPKSTLHGH